MAGPIDQNTSVRLSLVIPAIAAAVTLASAAGVALYQASAVAADVKQETSRAVQVDHAHDLQLQRQTDALESMGGNLGEIKREIGDISSEVREWRREESSRLRRERR